MRFVSLVCRGGVGIVLVLTEVLLYGQVAEQPIARIDRAFIRETVDSLASVVDGEYFDPDVAARVAASVRAWLAQGRYDTATTPESLAEILTRDLFEATKDKHLAVTVVQEGVSSPASTAPDEARELRARRTNFGVQRVEILAGNVGYLNLIAFYRPEEVRDTLSAVIRTLQHADALILDMRDNSGGSPDTAALLASYLFDAPALPLFDIVDRSGGRSRYTTEASPLPGRNGTRPVYVLTAARTFSAGEGIAFILQERRRAEVVGERTAGAANPGRAYPVNARFKVTVPNGQVRTAVAGRNWEGGGVVPDVAVAASDALRVAHTRAIRELLKKTPSGPWRDTLERQLEALER